MLQHIVQFSLRRRGVVIALSAMLLVYGAFVASRAKLDVFPDFVPPQATIQTEAPGLSAEQVEALVTRPVETAINGLGQQESLRSESIQGLSIVTVVFKDGTPVLPARQLVAEKLGELAGTLPAGVKTPTMGPLTSATMDLLKIGLISDRMSPMELRSFADWTLEPRLLAVPGVAKIRTFGGEVRQIQILVDPVRLLAHALTVSDILTAARQATGVRGAGFIETPAQRIVLQTEGQALTVAALGSLEVAATASGTPVRLRDMATVVDGSEPKFGDTLIMGRPGVLMTMASQYGANTLEVTRALEGALHDLQPVFEREGIKVYPRLHRPATFVEASLHNVRHSLLLGAGLVAAMLFLFLGHVRTAVISLLAIPLSLLSAIVVLDHFGVSLNTITLGGLAIALGEVVDDAIIDVENILRRLRENQERPDPRPIPGVILAASLEVRSAVVYATFIVALVFLPVLTLTGLQGSFFAPLAQSYILAILASLGVALTLTPALAAVLFRGDLHTTEPPRLQRWLRRHYERLLGWVVPRGAWIATLVAIVCALAVAKLPFLGGEFLPEFREGHFVVAVAMAPGTSLPEMLRVGRSLSARLLAIPQIDTVEQQIGRAEQGEDPWGPHRSEIHVELKPDVSGEEQAQVEDRIRQVLATVPGIQFEVMTFLGDRIGESITGETAPVVVNLFGEDLDLLDGKAREIAGVLAGVRGAADVQVKAPPGAPRLAIRLRPERLAAFGFRPVEVLEGVQTAFQGEIVGQVYHENRSTAVAVILDPAARRDPEQVRGLWLANAHGQHVALADLADVFLTSGRFSILHEGARRRQTITCNPAGRDVQSFVAEARAAIAGRVNLPAGMYVEYGGAAAAQQAATRQLLLHSAIAATGILILLWVVLGNGRNLLLVLANLPLALAGGVLAVYLTSLWAEPGEGALNLGGLVGFVTLFGITTRNAIMLVSHFEHLVGVERQTWDAATAIRGASERLVPILMTASVTALGLLPLALGSGEAGREIEGPMAVVILGGLFTSTVLNLVVLPWLALRWARWEPPQPTAP
jgi:CzcA family heavy metal efflux pump